MKQKFENYCVGKTSVTSLGVVYVAATQRGLIATQIGGQEETFVHELDQRFRSFPIYANDQLSTYLRQIESYFQGEHHLFEGPFHWGVMSPFQQKVLRAVYAIPYGETRTYGQIAAQIGAPRAARAVGRANATNPMPLVIPCHRLVGADGSLRGFGSGEGIKTKAWLLNFEKLDRT